MKKMCKNELGLAVGTFLGLFHFVWALMVAAKVAKPFLDWVLSLHSMQMDYSVLAFSLGQSALLVVMTFVLGYVFGWIFAALWNWYCKRD
jgi:ABC-type Fe3+ transport system permease subunit